MAMAFEKARAALIEMKKYPKASDKIRLCDVVSALAGEIKAVLKQGYSLTDVISTLKETEGIEIKEVTLRDYLHRYSKSDKPVDAKEKMRVSAKKDATATKAARASEKKPKVVKTSDPQASEKKPKVSTTPAQQDPGKKPRTKNEAKKAETKPNKPSPVQVLAKAAEERAGLTRSDGSFEIMSDDIS